MDKNASNTKKILGSFSILGIVADLITLYLFLKGVLYGERPMTLESIGPLILVIVSIFSFSLLLYHYSQARENYRNVDRIFLLFSWIYIIYAALFFAIISYYCIVDGNYTPLEFGGYLLLVYFVVMLGNYISRNISRINYSYFGIPFMLVGVEQCLLWTKIVLDGFPIKFDSVFLCNLSLIIISGLYLMFFIKKQS